MDKSKKKALKKQYFENQKQAFAQLIPADIERAILFQLLRFLSENMAENNNAPCPDDFVLTQRFFAENAIADAQQARFWRFFRCETEALCDANCDADADLFWGLLPAMSEHFYKEIHGDDE